MRKTLLAYMAGIVDGEGCLTIAKQIRPNRPSPSYRCSITVCNTDRRMIELFTFYFKGVVYKRPDNRVEKKWATSYTWYCPDGKAVLFLTSILPFLLIKKKQAQLLISFQEIKSSYSRKSLGQGRGSSPLSKKELSEKEKVYLKIKTLNTKGAYSRKSK